GRAPRCRGTGPHALADSGDPMTDLPPSPPPLPAPTTTTPALARNRPRRESDRAARTLGAVALVAAMVAAWAAIDARMALRDMESSAGGRLAELGAENRAAKT